LHVAENEFRRIGVVGINAADFCGGKEDIFGLFVGKKDFNCVLICQIKFAAVLEQKIIESFILEFADKSGADKTVMAGDEDFWGGVHD
jgi:hypothetical protein